LNKQNNTDDYKGNQPKSGKKKKKKKKKKKGGNNGKIFNGEPRKLLENKCRKKYGIEWTRVASKESHDFV